MINSLKMLAFLLAFILIALLTEIKTSKAASLNLKDSKLHHQDLISDKLAELINNLSQQLDDDVETRPKIISNKRIDSEYKLSENEKKKIDISTALAFKKLKKFYIVAGRSRYGK